MVQGEGYPDDWDARRRKVYQRDNYTCQNCGVQGGPNGDAVLHGHHIVPKSKGGSHQLANLQTLCGHCHDNIHRGGILSPKLSLGSSKKHLIYLFTTFGIGNIIHAINSLSRSASHKYTAWKRLKRANYGSLKVHILLFFTTLGIGNLIYYHYKSPKKYTISNSSFNDYSDNNYQYKVTDIDPKSDWQKAHKYPYDSYSDATDKVRQLKRKGRHDEAEELLLWCINYAEAEAKPNQRDHPRWYYKHLAIIYRKDDRYKDEIEILQQYISFCRNMDIKPRQVMIDRLERAKEIAERRY
jgi:hypothetical protein